MILAKHSEFWVIHKPAGIAINDEAETVGLMHQLAINYPELSLHPVHRLDKPTSGLLLVALTADANRELSSLFQKQAVEKTYIALTEYAAGKRPKKKQGAIIGDMAKSRNGNYKLLASKVNPARTSFTSNTIGLRRRFVILSPKTGKTHQLRVAMKSLSMPIVGDERYGGVKADRLYLHAYRLKFYFQGQLFDYTTKPASGDYFNDDALNAYWPLYKQEE